MNLIALQTRLVELYPGNDPLTAAQIDAAYSVLSAETVEAPDSTLKTERSLYAELGAEAAETVLAKFAAVAQSNAVVARVLGWMSPEKGGIDFSLAETQGSIAALHGAGVFTDAERDALLSLGVRQVAKWTGLSVETITQARSLE